MDYSGPDFETLSAGVDIFFVISGFIIWITVEKSNVTPTQFLGHRIVRIVPLYWAASLLTLGVLLTFPHALQTTVFNVWHVLTSFAFLPARNPVTGEFTPLLAVGWTVNYEMFFYLLVTVAIALPAGHRVLRVPFLIAAIAALCAIGLIFPTDGALSFYGNTVMLEFVGGLLLAKLFLANFRLDGRLAWLLFIAGWTLLATSSLWAWTEAPRLIRYGLPAILIVGSALHLPATAPDGLKAFMRDLGDSSYALYLSHGIVISALGQAWRKAGLSDAPSIFFLAAGTATCLLAGYATYRFVERPLAEIARKGSRPEFPAYQATVLT